MPYTTQLTTPETLQKLIQLHTACTNRIFEAVQRVSNDALSSEDIAAYARDVRQAESIAKFLRTPFREPSDSSPHSLQSGLTGVFLKELDEGDFVIKEQCMSNTSPMHDLLNKPLNAEAGGWTLIAIKF